MDAGEAVGKTFIKAAATAQRAAQRERRTRSDQVGREVETAHPEQISSASDQSPDQDLVPLEPSASAHFTSLTQCEHTHNDPREICKLIRTKVICFGTK